MMGRIGRPEAKQISECDGDGCNPDQIIPESNPQFSALLILSTKLISSIDWPPEGKCCDSDKS